MNNNNFSAGAILPKLSKIVHNCSKFNIYVSK